MTESWNMNALTMLSLLTSLWERVGAAEERVMQLQLELKKRDDAEAEAQMKLADMNGVDEDAELVHGNITD